MECKSLFKSTIKSTAGFSLAEVLVGSALLMVVVAGTMGGFSQLTKVTKANELSSVSDSRITEIIENIRQRPTEQIIQYAEDASSLLREADLKMAWSIKIDAPAADCAECQGRYGYVITPINKALGDLYLVTIVFTNTSWENPRQFEFVVSK